MNLPGKVYIRNNHYESQWKSKMHCLKILSSELKFALPKAQVHANQAQHLN